jgi:hypothetical protein
MLTVLTHRALQEDDQEADVEASIFEQYLSVCDQATVDPET